MSISSLKFLKQTSLSVDRFSDNGVEKNLHYVIKNNEFSVVVELPDNVENTNFNRLAIEAQLLYDCSPKPKEVLQVRQKPYKYKGIVERGDPRKCTLQVSISILSSQHEDMNFLLEIKAKDSETNKVVATGFSEPVQVISKPDVLRKKREPKKKKRTWNDRITETLERLEAKQNETIRLISSQQTCGMDSDPFQLLNTPKHPSEAFETAFYDLVRAYREMKEEERPTKIRKLVTGNQFDPTVNEMVSSLHSCTSSNSLDTSFPSKGKPSSTVTDYGTVKTEASDLFPSDFDINNLVEDLFLP